MKKQLTIAQVIPCDLAIHGGVQKHALTLGKYLERLGCRVVYFSPTKKLGNLEIEHVCLGSAVRMPNPNGSWAEVSLASKTQEEIAALIKREKVDLVHFQELLSPFLAWQILKASPVVNVATFHTGFNSDSLLMLLQFFLKNVRGYLDGFLKASIVVSPVAKRCNRNFLAGREVIIPPLVDFEPFWKKYPRPLEVVRGKVNLVYLGRLDQRKGFLYLVEALALLSAKAKKRAVLQVLGEGPYKKRAMKRLKELGLLGMVNFLGGVTEKEKVSFLQHADILVAPSTHGESFGMVLVEGMLVGLPIVAGNNDGYEWVLKDYPEKDLIVDPKEPDSLALALEKLINDRKMRERLGEWGRSYAQRFAPEKLAKEHLDLYRECLGI